jgi:hypothetical protein
MREREGCMNAVCGQLRCHSVYFGDIGDRVWSLFALYAWKNLSFLQLFNQMMIQTFNLIPDLWLLCDQFPHLLQVQCFCENHIWATHVFLT